MADKDIDWMVIHEYEPVKSKNGHQKHLLKLAKNYVEAALFFANYFSAVRSRIHRSSFYRNIGTQALTVLLYARVLFVSIATFELNHKLLRAFLTKRYHRNIHVTAVYHIIASGYVSRGYEVK